MDWDSERVVFPSSSSSSESNMVGRGFLRAGSGEEWVCEVECRKSQSRDTTCLGKAKMARGLLFTPVSFLKPASLSAKEVTDC